MNSSNKVWIKRFWIVFLLPIVFFVLMMFSARYGWLGFDPLPSMAELENPKSKLASEIISSDGQILGKYFQENRVNVRFSELSPFLLQALVATEDERYFDHSGIDFRGLVRAVAYMGKAGGASTITQQLAKMMFHKRPGNISSRIMQKLQEWILAVELEKRYTKEEIVTMYLNKFDFINNAVGIKSACNVYFNKDPKDLELQQAAMLVGMAKNPSLFNPIRRPERTMDRREVVLKQMLKNEFINQSTYDSLRVLPIGLDYKIVDHKEGIAPYFRETLRDRLKKMFAEKDSDGEYILHKKDGTPYNIYKDGLRIYTTIDSRMQQHAEWAVNEYLGKTLQPQFFKHLKKYRTTKYPFDHKISKSQFEAIMLSARRKTRKYAVLTGRECANCGRRGKFVKRQGNDFVCNAEDCGYKSKAVNPDSIAIIFDTKIPMKVFTYEGEKDTLMSPNDSIKYYKSFLQTGLMSVDPHTGFIKAWVGGVDFKHFAYDHVMTAKRQVGSTFKPFVYSVAIQNGYSPCYEVTNTKYTFHKGEFGLLKDWTPKNSDGTYGCDVSLKWALGNSVNTITAWIMKQFGPQAVVDQARSMGIKSDLPATPSLCLGVADLSVYEMVGANATFANKGVWIEPTMYTRIEDRHGNVILDVIPQTNEAMSEKTAYVMLDLMKGVVAGAYNKCTGRVTGTGMRLRGGVSKARPYVGHNYPIAGKTGTTQNNSDGWFIGITPDLVTGVWVGAEERSVRFATTYMGQGANTALPIWGYYMQKVHGDKSIGLTKRDFTPPLKGIDVPLNCRTAGDINTGGYDDFQDGDEGSEFDDI